MIGVHTSLSGTATEVTQADHARITAIETKAREAFAANLTYLNISTPTAAQNTAQVKRLTREVNAVLRLLLGDFSSASDV